jgi:NifU-like protein
MFVCPVSEVAMNRYSGLIREHFLNPRNVGDLKDQNLVGQAGSLSCGATVRISLRVNESQRITESRFKAAGCSFLVASASFLTEQLKGKTTGEAAALAQSPERAVTSHLGEPPAERSHCAALACEALVAAVRQYSDSVRTEWNGDEALICTCFGVSETAIETEIRTHMLSSIEEVTQACKAGAGCRSCYPLIQDILDTAVQCPRP